MLATLRYVDYPQAERDAVALAERLETRVGRGLVDEAHFLAIPRGGHIVLGMLVTALGVPSSQVGSDGDPERPVVVVDDCGLSGHRIGQWIAASSKRRIVVASLYAHPDLVRNMEAAEPRVLACVAGRDLRDCGEERLGALGYRAWRQRWEPRAEPPRYWLGVPEYLAFAWKEPDRMLVNRATGRTEDGWRTFPPALVLANRAAAAGASRVQVQADGPGPLRPAASVFVAEVDGGLVVADAERGGAVRLDAVAASMWRALVAHGTCEGAVAQLMRDYGVPGDQLGGDLGRFVDELSNRGLLEGASCRSSTSSRPGRAGVPTGSTG
jgi:hypothetical protein